VYNVATLIGELKRELVLPAGMKFNLKWRLSVAAPSRSGDSGRAATRARCRSYVASASATSAGTSASAARLRDGIMNAATVARNTTAAPIQSAGRHPVHERRSRFVAAVRRPDRSQDRDAEHAAELADRVLRARGT
jgi:hypothetical protein